MLMWLLKTHVYDAAAEESWVAGKARNIYPFKGVLCNLYQLKSEFCGLRVGGFSRCLNTGSKEPLTVGFFLYSALHLIDLFVYLYFF